MVRQGHQAVGGYRRLPRTVVITVLGLAALVAVAVHARGMKARREADLGPAARRGEHARRHDPRGRDDSEVARLFAADAPRIDDLARRPAADGAAREAARLVADPRTWANVGGNPVRRVVTMTRYPEPGERGMPPGATSRSTSPRNSSERVGPRFLGTPTTGRSEEHPHSRDAGAAGICIARAATPMRVVDSVGDPDGTRRRRNG